LNIKEEKISIMSAFLNKIEKEETENIKTDIKTKYNLFGDFIIYDS
jgi:hypothetical protein